MDNRAPYEIAIAKKAAECPLPDMSDAIWSSIAVQLDQLPTDTGHHQQPGKPAMPKDFGRIKPLFYFLSAVAVVITVVLIWLHKEAKKRPEKTTPSPAIVVPQAYPQKEKEQSADTVQAKQPAPVYAPVNKNGLPVTDSIITTNDSLKHSPVINLPVRDTIHSQLIKPRDSAGIQVIQKPRGVKGITGEDYRIIPTKKDSIH